MFVVSLVTRWPPQSRKAKFNPTPQPPNAPHSVSPCPSRSLSSPSLSPRPFLFLSSVQFSSVHLWNLRGRYCTSLCSDSEMAINPCCCYGPDCCHRPVTSSQDTSLRLNQSTSDPCKNAKWTKTKTKKETKNLSSQAFVSHCFAL